MRKEAPGTSQPLHGHSLINHQRSDTRLSRRCKNQPQSRGRYCKAKPTKALGGPGGGSPGTACAVTLSRGVALCSVPLSRRGGSVPCVPIPGRWPRAVSPWPCLGEVALCCTPCPWEVPLCRVLCPPREVPLCPVSVPGKWPRAVSPFPVRCPCALSPVPVPPGR